MQAPPPESAARRYRIEKYLTEGGMGAIYIGKKLGPGGFAKEVVLKQLLPEYTSRPEFRDLFFREAKISATLDHANIVHTFDLVESDQSLFIVMEYVRGADLRTIIRRARHRKREISPAAAIHVALEILAGLGYAHTRRDARGRSLDIIHRDVSPSNIICSIQGNAKLSDFGIAKASTYSSVFYRVRGKVGYMSPEQARSQQIDHRCDLFSLSVCLYESLSGERLFVGDLNTPADEIYGLKPLPVSQKRAGLPPALDEVLKRALAANVDDRYQSAAELADALRTVAYKAGLAFSAPELAAHLQDILGPDPERWLRDEPAAVAANDHAPAAAGGAALVGREAASIGIVNDIPGNSVLSPRAVSGSKDFDLDSMLNDEATRPGGDARPEDEAGPAPAGQARPAPTRPDSSQLPARVDDARPRAVGSPPPIWTRDSGPFALATPRPSTTAAEPSVPRPTRPSPATVPAAIARPTAAGAGPVAPPARPGPSLSGGPPAPPPARAGRPLPRATIRGTSVPPPVPVGGRGGPPPPPPPVAGAAASARPAGATTDEIEDATPVPISPRVSPPGGAHRGGFEIEDVLTPPPPTQVGPAPFVDTSAPPRSLPAPYPVPAPPQVLPSSGASFQRAGLQSPQTIDFAGAVTDLLTEKKGGPPAWLAAMLILTALVGGAALAHRLTRSEVAAAVDIEPRSVRRQPPPGNHEVAPADDVAAPGTAVTPSPAAGADDTVQPNGAGHPIARPADSDPPLAGPDPTPAGVSAHPSRVIKAGTRRHHVKPSARRRAKH